MLLHETQLWIIEAASWIERPMSATDLTALFELDEDQLSSVSYHCTRLHKLGVLVPKRRRRVRGARETFFGLRQSLEPSG